MGNNRLNRRPPVKVSIRLKRASAVPADDDGFRVLVDRLWPRGISKAQLRLDAWAKELAPSTALRQWFSHDAGKWPEFKERYFGELSSRQEQVARLVEQARIGRMTLVYAAKEDRYNNAVALKEHLEQIMRHPAQAPAGKESHE